MATMTPDPSPWAPTRVTRVIRGLDTSTGALYVMTDAGRAYAKTLGNPEGPDALISEWIGTGLARWLGLPTFDVAVVDYPEELRSKLPKGCETQAGPAFVAREVRGRSWGGGEDDLTLVENPEVISGLVVVDMWTRNHDRFAEDGDSQRRNVRNVFFCEEGARRGRYRLLAMDHSECFRTGRALAAKGLFAFDAVHDERLYGLFPEFRSYVTREDVRPYVDRLNDFNGQAFDEAARGVPAAWGLRSETREALRTFCVDRAKFLVRGVEKILEDACRWHPELPGTDLR
jgi:hypothetical protein